MIRVEISYRNGNERELAGVDSYGLGEGVFSFRIGNKVIFEPVDLIHRVYVHEPDTPAQI